MTARIALLLSLALLIAVPTYAGGQVWTTGSERSKGWLGVETQDVTGRLRDRKHLTVDAGAYVSNVIEDSPAESAGIEEGDVITSVDGKKIDDAEDLTSVVRKIKPETEVKIEVNRKGEKKTLTATLERSRAPEAFTYRFDGGRDHRIVIPRMPKMPRMPNMPHRELRVFVNEESYGMELQELTKQLADYFEVPAGHGLLVTSVTKGGTADQAGFKAGDVIVKLDGETIRDMGDFQDAVRSAGEGKEVPCDVVRKGKPQSLKWKPESDEGDEDDDDFSFMSCPPTPAAAVHCAAPRSGLGERLDVLQAQLVERITWLRDLVSSKLAALWRPIEQQFS